MTSKLFGATAIALLLAGSAAGAMAQTRARSAPARPAPAAAPAAAPAQPPLTHGPAIPGLCIFSNERAIGTSSVGKAASTRMQQLRAQVSAELSAEQTSLQNDARALEAKRSSLTQDQFAQQAEPLNKRSQAFQQRVSLRERELERTGAVVMQRISQQLEPIIRQLYVSHRCSLLLNGDSAVLAANPAMDITEDAVAQLNVRMSTITFDRERLDTVPAGQQ